MADHPCVDISPNVEKEIEIGYISLVPWTTPFDRSSRNELARVGIVISSPFKKITQFSFKLSLDCSNNQAEYEALIIGLKILLEMEISTVKMFRDSQLVINQLAKKFKVRNDTLEKYHSLAICLIDKFSKAVDEFVPSSKNAELNELA